MRFIFIISGFAGFVLVALAGASAERAPELVLRDAALGCLFAAMLGRWFWRVVQNAVAQTAAARRAAAEAAAHAEADAAPLRPAAARPATPTASHPASAPLSRPAATASAR